jgi:hypothetical protein
VTNESLVFETSTVGDDEQSIAEREGGEVEPQDQGSAEFPAPFCDNLSRTGRDVSRILFWDLETVPDWEQVARVEGEAAVAELLGDGSSGSKEGMEIDVAESLKGTVAEIEKLAKNERVDVGQLEALRAGEAAGKGRAGVLGKLSSQIKSRQEAGGKRIKKYSVTPEYCRIVAFGFAMGFGEVQSVVANDRESEADLLRQFWEMAERCSPLSGYNILGFDLPVIFVRSAILGVLPTTRIDMRPFGNKGVLDLMNERFGRGNAIGLKTLCRMYGIAVPAGDMDGSQVFEMIDSDPEKVAEYVESDVVVLQWLFAKLSGLFWF